MVREYEASTGDHVSRVFVDREPPLWWSTVIGDALHNLRSALDHTIEAMTIRWNGTRLDRTEFPIFTDPAKFWALDKKGDPARPSGLHKIRGIPFEAQAFIEELQPYPGRPNRQILETLHTLNNVDKHRTLHLTSAALPQHIVTVGGGPGTSEVYLDFMKTGPFENGDEMATLAHRPDRSRHRSEQRLRLWCSPRSRRAGAWPTHSRASQGDSGLHL